MGKTSAINISRRKTGASGVSSLSSRWLASRLLRTESSLRPLSAARLPAVSARRTPAERYVSHLSYAVVSLIIVQCDM